MTPSASFPFGLAALAAFTSLAVPGLSQEAGVETAPAEVAVDVMAQAGATKDPLVSEAMVAKILEEGIRNSQAMRILTDLTGKIGHRLTGSENLVKGAKWARDEFRAMGLKAELEEWGQWQTIWSRGEWVGRVIAPEPIDLFIATSAWTAGTDGLQRGQLVAMPDDEGDFAARAKQLKGKYLFGRLTRSNGDAFRRLANEHGVLGFVSAARGNAQYPNRVRVFGDSQVARGSIDNVPTIPEIVVRADHADILDSMVHVEEEEVIVEFDIQNAFKAGPISLYNVVAEIPGATKPDEVVIVCGHLDSWHQATGTTDNGTGTTTTLETARILSKVGAAPDRTIRFCLWSGEEQGLLGSAAYVKMHRTEMEKVCAVYNHDTGTNWAQSITVANNMADDFERILAPVKEHMKAPEPEGEFEGPVFNLKTAETISGGGGSDHASFIAAGVPAWAWSLEGRSDYFGYTWHTQWDTLDVAIPEYLAHTSTVISLAVLGTANLEQLIDRSSVKRRSGRGDASTFIAGIFGVEMTGLKFKSVNKGAIAEKAGIRAGDVLKTVNGKKVDRAREILQAMRDGGEVIKLGVSRGEETVIAEIKMSDITNRRRRGRGNARTPATTEGKDGAKKDAPDSVRTPAKADPKKKGDGQ